MSPTLLLAAYGSDCAAARPVVERALTRGAELLALDTQAVADAITNGYAYRLIEDWVTSDERLAAYEAAERLEKDWISEAGKFFQGSPTWPALDHLAMHHYWHEISIVEAFARHIRETEEIAFFPREPKRGGTYPEEWPRFGSSYVFGTRLQEVLPSIARPLKPAPIQERARLNAIDVLKTASRPIRKTAAQARLARHSVLTERIGLVFRWNEADRLRPIVSQLIQCSEADLVGICHSSDPLFAKRTQDQWGIPIIHLPSVSFGHPDVPPQYPRFGSHINRALKLPSGFHLTWALGERFPLLERIWNQWHHLLSQHKPRLLLVPVVSTAEKRIPAVVSRRLQIPSLGIPHGAIEHPPDIPEISAILYGLPLQAALHRRPSQSLLPAREAFLEREYHVRPVYSGRVRFNITVLSEQPGFPDLACPFVSIDKQISAFRELQAQPHEMKDDILVRFKTHPNGMELTLLRSIISNPSQIAPQEADLISILEMTDLVVAVNYCGSALVHALRLQLPTILLWNDPLFGSHLAHRHASLFRDKLELWRSERHFWERIRPLLADEGLDHLARKSSRFAAAHLAQDAFPSICDVLRDQA